MVPALELRDVRRSFGGRVAVDGLTLALAPGETLGLLGRNGAGKSTTVRLVAGMLPPDSGSVRVCGLDVEARPLETKRAIGILPEDGALFDRLTGSQYLRLVGRLYGVADEEIERRAGELFGLLELDPGERSLVCDWSTGMRKKLAFSAALLHAPRLLLLDEPFESVDPIAARAMKDVLERLRERGVAVLVASHLLDVVERTCTRVAILEHGRLLAEGGVQELLARHGEPTLEALFLRLLGRAGSGALSWLA